MSEKLLNSLWETLEKLAAAMESPEADRGRLAVALEGCLGQVLLYPPAELVAQAEQSALPTRPLVSWLVYEADRLGQAAEGQALREYWQDNYQVLAGSIISPPRRAMI